MRHHRFGLALILIVAAVLFLGPLIRGEVFTLRDHFDYFQPLRWFTAEELKDGRLPLWNPYSASGEPWLANPQTGVFYPPALIFLVLPFPAAYMLFLLGHLVLLGWGAYLLFARTASAGAAMVGAIALMLGGPTLSLLDINNNLCTLAWLPLVLWCAAERAWRRGAIVLAISFLAGEPFFAGVGAVMFAIVAARSMKTIALAGIAAFGLAAVQLFPFLEAIRDSDRATGMKPELIVSQSMPLRDWLRVVIPPSLNEHGFDPALGQHFIPVIYIGVIVAALALAGLGSIRKPHVAGWLVLLVASVAIAAGPAFLTKLPLTLFRYPARMIPLGALAIAGLAVAGLERIRSTRPRWVDLLLVLVIVADLLLRSWPLLVTGKFDPDVVATNRNVGRELKIVRIGKTPVDKRARWLSGYLNLYHRRFDASTAAPFENDRYLRYFTEAVSDPAGTKFNALSVGWVIMPLPAPSWVRPYSTAGGVAIHRHPHGWPMARLMRGSQPMAQPWEMTTSSAKITVDAPQGGTVVLAQQHAPGWRVTVDGVERPARVSDGVFRSVDVPKGRHEIVWSYRPWSLTAGAIVTIITMLAIGISIVVKRSR